MTSRQNKISIVSQGGLTSPKLFYQGPDFPNRSRKRWKERHVRISCINVTNTLSSVVIISHPNQLQYCRTRKISGSQVLQLCFTESVADMSLLQICQSSVVNMFYRIVADMSRCKYVTSSCNYVFYRIVAQIPRCKYVTSSCNYVFYQVLPKCHCDPKTTPKSAKMSQLHKYHRPPTEGIRDPTEGIRDPTDGKPDPPPRKS